MKNKIFIILIVIICFISFKVYAYDEAGFDYLNITYNFVNYSDYYVTYEFKPKEIVDNKHYFLKVNSTYPNSVESNIKEFNDEYNDNIIDINFYLDEVKDYYIKYKGSIKRNDEKSLCLNPITSEIQRGTDESDAVNINKIKISIINPKYVNLTKEKFENIDNVFFRFDDDSYVLKNGNKVDTTNEYGNVCFQILKYNQGSNTIVIYIGVATALILIIAYGIFSNIKDLKNDKRE